MTDQRPMEPAEGLVSIAAPATSRREKLVVVAVCVLATLHLVWFYINRVPSFLELPRYEAGLEKMPYQGRLLMEYPLRWAHGSAALAHLAAGLNQFHMWLPRGVLPEDLVEWPIGVMAVAVAGLVARTLYRAHSKTRLLSGYMYPLVLLMVAGSYCVVTTHFFRYVYDLPSLGLFAVGLYCIFRRWTALFAVVFVVATVNRETSLFLLFFLLVSACAVGGQVEWKRALDWRVGGTVGLLAAFWLGWHIWVVRHFAALASDAEPRLGMNAVALLWPLAWPQLAGIAGYTLLPLLVFRRGARALELRLWMGIVLLWGLFMVFFGMLIEIRLFGELIPVFACLAALLAEERILQRTRSRFSATGDLL